MSNVEQLESRTLFVGTIEVAPDVGGMLHDASRNAVYVTSGSHLQAYSPGQGTPGGSLTFGQKLGGLDITPDNATLYVTDRHPQSNGDPRQGVLYKVDLTSDAVTAIAYPLTEPEWGQGGGSNVAVMSNGKAFVVSEAPSAPLREVDLATGSVRIVSEVSNGGAVLGRSADRHTLFLHRDGGDVLYDALDGSYTARPGPSHPAAFVAVSPDGRYIAHGTTVVDRSFNVVANIPNTDVPGVFDPIDPLLYTINSTGASAELTVINTQTWRPQFSFYPDHGYSTVPRDPAIKLMEISPDGGKLLLRRGSPTGEGTGITPVDLTPKAAIAPAAPAVSPGRPLAFSFGRFSRPGAPLKAFTGTLRFSSDDPAAELPPDTRVELRDGEDADFSAALKTPGHRHVIATVLETGVTSRWDVLVDDAPPIARVDHAYRSGLPGRDNLYRVVAEIVDNDAVDSATEGDADPEFVAVEPDGTVYPLSNRIPFPPPPPNAYCSGHCPDANDATRGFYPEVAGTYVLRLLPGSVADRVGNLAAGADLGVVEVTSTSDLAATLHATPPRSSGARKVAGVLTVSNSGTTAVQGSVKITVAVEPGGAGDAVGATPGGAPVVERAQKLRLAPGQSRRVKVRVNLPADLAAGSYRLVARVTPAAGMPTIETSRANNTAAAAPFQLGSSPPVATQRPASGAAVEPSIESLERRTLASGEGPTSAFRAPESAGRFLAAPGPESVGVPQLLYPQVEMARRGSVAFYDPPVTGAPSWQFGMVFSGPDGVDSATTVGADLVTVESDGRTLPVTYLGQAGDATLTTSYFRVDAPGGTWDVADNGEYAVRLKGDRVASVGGHRSPARTVQTFDISVPERGPDLTATWSARSSPAALSLRNGRAATVLVSVSNVGTLPMAYPAHVTVKLAKADAGTAAGAVGGATDFFNPEPSFVGGTTVKRLNLQPGQSKLVKVRVRAANSLPDGAYRYEASVFTSSISEPNDHNNVDPNGPMVNVVQGSAAPLPNAALLRISLTSDPAAARGGYVSATVTVEHAGGSVGRYVGEAHVGSGPRLKFSGKLAPGEQRVHKLRVYIPPDARISLYGDVQLVANMKSFSLPRDRVPQTYSDLNNVVIRG